MSNIAKRLRASLKFDAINGDGFERSVCAGQMQEAAAYIDELESRITKQERGEFICSRCGLRKDGENSGVAHDF